MARFASPALGCQLRLVEVEIGAAKETYDPEQFNEPLELSLEGQRSLGSDCGILSLLITTGTRQMLLIRLNDLLSHPNGTEGIICVDKGRHQLCVKLPNRDHILRVWFVEERDFLISVCILRKSGFKIGEGKVIQHKGTVTANTNNGSQPIKTSASQQSPFSCTTPLALLTAQAKSLCNDNPNPFPTRKPQGGNIFDEVLESLQRLSGDSKSGNTVRGDLLSEKLGSHDLSYLNPYHAFSTKKKVTLNQPNVGSPLRNVVNQEQRHECEIKKLKATCPTPKPTRKHSHRYFTRSFSSSISEGRQNKKPFPSSSLKAQRNASVSVDEIFADSTSNAFSASFDSSPAVSLRQLMPRRRKLPFSTDAKNTHKKSRPTGESAEVDPCRELGTPPMAPGGTQLNKLRSDSPETTIILTHLASLDELDEASRKIFDQYEKDVARGCDQEQCALFYLERLHIIRSNFWLKELLRVSNSDQEILTNIQSVTNKACAMN
ncbi:hypothetical protein J3458_000503 [Metarhizium acridum]|uniref:uncharacterized protein n=1 Tax=Metarhizium acridum TaxID=92637 RepID=UPI001C6C3B93|nr:hypothetical protein J3458_000503 [Metarhizium acridum]